jgi:hypothetical protein
MTTAAQIKKLVKPFLERHADLVLDGQWFYLKPVHHLLRTILFDRTGQAVQFKPRWAVITLFRPTNNIDLKYGSMLRGTKTKLWYWNDPEMPAALFDAIENQALPAMQSIETLDDFVKFTSDPDRFWGQHMPAFPALKLPIDVAQGDLDSARSICQKWSGRAPRWPEDPLGPMVKGLCPLLAANDRAGLVRQLHEWEEYTVKQLKLEKIWEPSSFPIELGGA